MISTIVECPTCGRRLVVIVADPRSHTTDDIETILQGHQIVTDFETGTVGLSHPLFDEPNVLQGGLNL